MLPRKGDSPFSCLGGACKVEHPELSLHFLCLQAPFELLQEVHHGRVSLKVGEVVVHPQEQNTGHLVTELRVLKPVKKLVCNDYRCVEKGPVGEEEVLNVGRVCAVE